MNVTMVLTAMVNSGDTALVVFVAESSYCGGDSFEDEFFNTVSVIITNLVFQICD